MDANTAVIVSGLLNAIIVAAATIYVSRGINKSANRIEKKQRASKILNHLSKNAPPLAGAPLLFGFFLHMGITLLWGNEIAKIISGYLLVTYSTLGLFILFFYLYYILILDVDYENPENKNE